jgi:hypothetical protein
LKKVEDDDLLVSCMKATAKDICNTRKDGGYCSNLIRRDLMNRKIKFREIFLEFQGTLYCLSIFNPIIIHTSWYMHKKEQTQ